MQITFLRLGHSNNSSSSHSLIFAPQDVSELSDEGSDFGWWNFICSSKEHKTNYLLTCLRSCFEHGCGEPFRPQWGFLDERWRNITEKFNTREEEQRLELFREWVRLYFNINTSDLSLEDHVDHQSMIYFPYERDGRTINKDFARKFIEEFVDNSWYVFGGNDNSEDESNPPTERTATELNSFSIVWDFLTDIGYENNVMCVEDKLTGEFVLSKKSGPIIKIIF